MTAKVSPQKVRFISQKNHDNDETRLNNDMFGNAITKLASNNDEYSKLDQEDSDIFNDALAEQEQEKMEGDKKILNSSKSTLNNQKRRFSSTTSLYDVNGNENTRRTSIKTQGARRNASGIQRLEYELSNLKSRLFDSLQEYEDFKDSFPDKHFPAEWEPPPVRDLRSKVDRLSMRIEREKYKLKMKRNDKEVRKMVESILDQCDNDSGTNDNFDPLERFTVGEIINDEPLNESCDGKESRVYKSSRNSVLACGAPFWKVPDDLKTRQRRLFVAGAVPPRTLTEREASKAALHCALSRLPPIPLRIKSRKFCKMSASEAEDERRKLVMVPNKRRLASGRAFVHERQKEFVSFHKKRFHEMDVTFTRTDFEGLS